MTNREKYLFDEFTFAKYPKHIELALSRGFEFVGFQEQYDWSRKLIIWRHDVEFSPWIARRMAGIESDLGVRATYFYQTHSEFYNLFERAVTDLALQTKELGHFVGLHFDPHFWGLDTMPDGPEKLVRMEDCIRIDAECFQKVTGIVPDVFSFHLTTPFIRTLEDFRYGGLINAYAKIFKEKFAYNGDSTGCWRYEKMDDRLTDPNIRHVQILTHDANWTDIPMAPRRRGFLAIDQMAEIMKKRWDGILDEFGADNIDEDVVIKPSHAN